MSICNYYRYCGKDLYPIKLQNDNTVHQFRVNTEKVSHK